MLQQFDTAVLLPTMFRPQQLKRVLKSLRDTAPDIKVIVALEPDDLQSREIAIKWDCIVAICQEGRQGCAYAWNTALAKSPDYIKAFVLGADDLIFQPGWFEETAQKLKELGGSGLVGFNDDFKPVDSFPWSTHYLMTRDFIEEHNGGVMAIPYYTTDFVDLETCSRAMRVNQYIKAPNAHVTHDWNGLHPDEHWLRGTRKRETARQIMLKRKELGWPDDFPAVIGKRAKCQE